MIEKIEAILNIFPEVKWDRWIGTIKHLYAYGWIARDDGRSDFMSIEIKDGKWENFFTSSAKHSEIFAKRVNSKHSVCNRVENHFKNTNHIKLEKPDEKNT